MTYRVEYDISAGVDDQDAGRVYEVVELDAEHNTRLVAAHCEKKDADRMAAALSAVVGTETEKIEFLVDSRNKGWELAKTLQKQVDEVRGLLRNLLTELNCRGELDPKGCDHNTGLATAYWCAIQMMHGDKP